MKIIELELITSDIPAQYEFYTQVLGIPMLATTYGVFRLLVGESRLTFRQAPQDWQGCYHLAFTIPTNQFDAAKSWITARVPLLTDSAGNDTFFGTNWNIHSLYFADATGNILELIARHTLANESDEPFRGLSLLSISEIGIVTDDVHATARMLQTETGITYYDSGNEQFAALGDDQGLLIVVERGRIWFPETSQQPADDSPLTVVVETAPGTRYRLDGPPISVTPEEPLTVDR
jgi:catechol-2,3-dioxygenase